MDIPNVFVMMGDGETQEGSIWEAAMSAPKFKLKNLYAIIDKNNFQQTGSNKEIMDLGNLSEKWKSFGWETIEVDGHNIESLLKVFSEKNNYTIFEIKEKTLPHTYINKSILKSIA